MRVVLDKRKTRAVQPFSVQPPNAGHQAALDAIHFWSSLEGVVEFAQMRRSYENQDCHAGVDYDEHLDESQLPDGYVAAYNGHGELESVRSHAVPESEYLQLLRQYAVLNGRDDLAEQLNQYIREGTA